MGIESEEDSDLTLQAEDAEAVTGGAVRKKAAPKKHATPAVRNQLVTMPPLGPASENPAAEWPEDPNAEPLC